MGYEIEYTVGPFKMKDICINAIWVRGIPYFDIYSINKWLGGPQVEVYNALKKTPEIINHMHQTTLDIPTMGNIHVTILYDLYALYMIASASGTENGLKFKKMADEIIWGKTGK